jgi:8-oxo-dGTP pyrophosphatase MutT (NUDIX family)
MVRPTKGRERRPDAVSLDAIRLALRGTLTEADESIDGKTAAVAAVLRERDGEIDLLFIRRAKRRGDPWSGHMAWPGGKREPTDAGMAACAVRETKEEVGLDLDEAAELVGRLKVLRVSSGARGLRAVFAFVFVLTHDAPLAPGPEVQEAVWIPLRYFEEWKMRRPWSWMSRRLPSVPPAYRYGGRLIWGLTLWLLADLLQRCPPVGATSTPAV